MAFATGEEESEYDRTNKPNEQNWSLPPSVSPNTGTSVSSNDCLPEYQQEGVNDAGNISNHPQQTSKKRSFHIFDADNNHNRSSNTQQQPVALNEETYNVQKSPIKKQKTSDQNIWSCVLCTLDNRMSDRLCAVCQAPKPDADSNHNIITNNHHQPQQKALGEYKQSAECKNSDDSNNISTLINGLKKFQINANAKKNDDRRIDTNNNDSNSLRVVEPPNDALNSMDGLIGQLQGFQFDKAANSAISSSSKMNDIMQTLSSLDINHSNQQEIDSMVKGINAEIHRFILDLQQSLYWRFKIKNEEKKFRKLERRQKASIDRIIQILTFYHDHYDDEFSLVEYVNDDESHYKRLCEDYKHVITENIICNNNLIRMKSQFSLISDYVSQNLPKCESKTCRIYQRYHDEEEEDDDMFDDDVKYFKKTMDIIHAYFFHADRCGIMVEQHKEHKEEQEACAQTGYLEPGGKWYWFYDDADVKWVAYTDEHQQQLNRAWMSCESECVIGEKYKIRFKRNSNNRYPSGTQHDCHHQNSWRRAIIYGVEDRDGLLNGMICQKHPL